MRATILEGLAAAVLIVITVWTAAIYPVLITIAFWALVILIGALIVRKLNKESNS